ncbi:hypothetical protein RYX36_029277 [Vicia faba]
MLPFEVKREYLKGALKRFSQYFISPLVKAEAMEQEVQAAKGWATSLSAGVGDDRVFRSSIAYVFVMSTHLTDSDNVEGLLEEGMSAVTNCSGLPKDVDHQSKVRFAHTLLLSLGGFDVASLIGSDTVSTMLDQALLAFIDHDT